MNLNLSAPKPRLLQTRPLYTNLYMWHPPMTSALSFLNQILICLQLVFTANFFFTIKSFQGSPNFPEPHDDNGAQIIHQT